MSCEVGDDTNPAVEPRRSETGGWHGDGGCRDDRGCWRLSRDDNYTSVEPRGREVGAEMIRSRRLSRDDTKPAAGPGWYESFGGWAEMARVWQWRRDDTSLAVEPRTRVWRFSREDTRLACEPRSHEFGV
ncbi:hypothetical protein Bbelb_377010 [Branchiostoma belcheri]|nr:hypothetical protein Bbelb_377010 [Branchiostoma belcheri]